MYRKYNDLINAVKNPFEEVMLFARKEWDEKKKPFNQTYYETGHLELIDDATLPPTGMEIKQTNFSFNDDQRTFIISGLYKDGIIETYIKPIGMLESAWRRFLDKITNLNQGYNPCPF